MRGARWKYPLTVFTMVVVLGVFYVGSPLTAEELSEGTVITAENLDRYKDDTFQGHTIDELVTDEMEILVKQHGWELPLKKTMENYGYSDTSPRHPSFYKATQMYAENVGYDPESGLLTGEYKAGLPFPDVEEEEPNAAAKLVWNQWLGLPHTHLYDFGVFSFPLLDNEDGFVRKEVWWGFQYRLKNQYHNLRNPVENPGSALWLKQLLFAVYPQDVAGVGIFFKRYLDGRTDDSWVYIKSLRRTRRLTGGAWMDPVDGTLWLNDDFEGQAGNPSWYQLKLVEKQRTVLSPVPIRPDLWKPQASGLQQQFLSLKMDSSNKCAPNPEYIKFVPRDVWVIESVPPTEHPYGKRKLLLDKKLWLYNWSFAFDKNDNFWKVVNIYKVGKRSSDGDMWGMPSAAGNIVDYKKGECSPFIQPKANIGTEGVDADDISLKQLKLGKPLTGFVDY